MPDNVKEAKNKVPTGADLKSGPGRSMQGSDGRIDRVLHETRQLGDDLMEWVNLRLRLIQFDFQDRIDEELDLVFSAVIVLAAVVIALLLASFGIAFILGDLLGKLWYGFGIMALLYLVVAAILSRIRPRLAAGFRSGWARESADTEQDVRENDQ